jgi:hypothetical protein
MIVLVLLIELVLEPTVDSHSRVGFGGHSEVLSPLMIPGAE